MIPAVLFDGFAVTQALTALAVRRTGPENVADTLDAVVRLLRQEPERPAGFLPYPPGDDAPCCALSYADGFNFCLAEKQQAAAPAGCVVDDGLLPDALVPHAKEWYRLCERRFAVDRITISGQLAEAIVIALAAAPKVSGANEIMLAHENLIADHAALKARAGDLETQCANLADALAAEVNGPTFMGEPLIFPKVSTPQADPAPAVAGDLDVEPYDDELDAVFMAQYLPLVAAWCQNNGAHATGVQAIRQAGELIADHARIVAAKDAEIARLRVAHDVVDAAARRVRQRAEALDGEELYRLLAQVAPVGTCNGHDVIRRASVLELVKRRIDAAAAQPQADR